MAVGYTYCKEWGPIQLLDRRYCYHIINGHLNHMYRARTVKGNCGIRGTTEGSYMIISKQVLRVTYMYCKISRYRSLQSSKY